MRISDWSSDVCSSDLRKPESRARHSVTTEHFLEAFADRMVGDGNRQNADDIDAGDDRRAKAGRLAGAEAAHLERSEEHTSELQSLMRISYAVFCLQNTKH